jgi:hypothetical protein
LTEEEFIFSLALPWRESPTLSGVNLQPGAAKSCIMKISLHLKKKRGFSSWPRKKSGETSREKKYYPLLAEELDQ